MKKLILCKLFDRHDWKKHFPDPIIINGKVFEYAPKKICVRCDKEQSWLDWMKDNTTN